MEIEEKLVKENICCYLPTATTTNIAKETQV